MTVPDYLNNVEKRSCAICSRRDFLKGLSKGALGLFCLLSLNPFLYSCSNTPLSSSVADDITNSDAIRYDRDLNTLVLDFNETSNGYIASMMNGRLVVFNTVVV